MKFHTIWTFAAQFVYSQAPEGVWGSTEASQAAIKSFEFIIRAPGNCLQTLADLPTSVSKNMAALWLRAVFHDAGTFDPKRSRPGGLDASLLHFLGAPENAGLEQSIAPRFMQNRMVNMTKADMIALAAQVSVTHCGGPRFAFHAGRADATVPTSPSGLIPSGNATLDQLRPHFARMGWSNEDIVALVTGSHTLGGVHGKNSPEVTQKDFIPFDDTAGIFDNHVFKFALEGKCVLKIDCEIAKDAELRAIVQRYIQDQYRFASDQDAFFDQYQKSFTKLLNQTSSRLGLPQDLIFERHANLNDIAQPPVQFESTSSGSKSIGLIPWLLLFASILLHIELFL
jgi:catalase (peroxidase I)